MVERKLFSDEFLATVRTKDGKDYELDSFRVMVTTFDRCLTEKEYKRSIILEGGFKSWKQILEEKFQLLRQKLRQRQAAQLVSHDKIKTTIKEKRKRKEKKERRSILLIRTVVGIRETINQAKTANTLPRKVCFRAFRRRPELKNGGRFITKSLSELRSACIHGSFHV